MKSNWHVLFGFIISYVLVQFFHFSLASGVIIFLSSFLIDLDHYFWYIFAVKDWSPINAINWNRRKIKKWFSLSIEERNKFQRGFFIFHGLFFWVLLAILGYYVSEVFLWILIGVMVHMAADLPDLLYHQEPLYNKTLPCWVIFRNRGKKSLKNF